MAPEFDAVVVGAGPNGLSAAVELARNDYSVLIVEARDRIGGGARTQELTLPGFRHDVCSAIHPFGAGSPFFEDLPLADHGLEWVHPPSPLAHPLDGGVAAVLHRSPSATAERLGPDGAIYQRLIEPLVGDWGTLRNSILAPILRLPRHPLSLARFGLRALLPASRLVRRFHHTGSRALFAGLAAHSIAPLTQPFTAGVALSLGIAGHAVGWPIARGGSQAIVDALASYLQSLGGQIETSTNVTEVDQLPAARAVLFDTTPRQLVRIAGDRLPDRYRRKLDRFRHGPGVFKVDWALSGPIPWQAPECSAAAALHVGGTFEEIASAEAAVAGGEHPAAPFIIFAQPSLFDESRAPPDRHIAWGYTHVPNGSTVDMTDRIESQIERFAPGFRDLILERSVMTTADFEAYSANYIGGDIAGGALSVRQIIARPIGRPDPYRTPADGIFICSSSTPPGAGVHGMCGYHAARSALRYLRKT